MIFLFRLTSREIYLGDYDHEADLILEGPKVADRVNYGNPIINFQNSPNRDSWDHIADAVTLKIQIPNEKQ